MVAYFKHINNLFMAVFGIVGGSIGWLCYPMVAVIFEDYMRLFVLVLFAFAGVVIGRILSSVYAQKRCAKIYSILYTDNNIPLFLETFEPLVGNVPHNLIEYVDGMHHIAFAYEGSRNYNKALDILNSLNPDRIRVHHLLGNAIVTNHKMRLYLLLRDSENAEAQFNILSNLIEVAEARAPKIAENLISCRKVGSIWLKALKEPQSCIQEEVDYIREEYSLAANEIYRNEMNALLCEISK